MQFAITFMSPPTDIELFGRIRWITQSDARIKRFDSQKKAYKWLAKYGDPAEEYHVEPFHVREI